MHASVRTAWAAFNEPLEGRISKPYADTKGLITVAMGNLIDPIDAALVLPWELLDGTAATREHIVSSWNVVKNDPQCASRGWTYATRLPGNMIRLSEANIDALIYSKLDQNDAILCARVPEWDARPADAQLAVHSMSWAMGPSFWRKFPKFDAAFSAGDYMRASLECAIQPEGGTVRRRNQRNKLLLTNAMQVVQNASADRGVLIWS